MPKRSTVPVQSSTQTKKLILLTLIILLLFLIFLAVMLKNALLPRHLPFTTKKVTEKASRGNIISSDGFTIASTEKLYKAVVDTRTIDSDKKELFIKLFSIYSNIDERTLANRLRHGHGQTVLSYSIGSKQAQYLKTLAYEMRRMHIFKEIELPNGRMVLYGLNILESGERRIYNHTDLLTPIIGYPKKVEIKDYTAVAGVKGLEKQYNTLLSRHKNGLQQGKRDVNGYIILDKHSNTVPVIDGATITLNIAATLQVKLESIASSFKKRLGAKEIMVALMKSDDARILALASSNRFNPSHIFKRDYPSLNAGAIEYSFEPGSVLKPVIFSLLLDENKINPYDLVNTHNGRFKMGRKVIRDEHAYDWLSAENVIVHSSNIGIAQLAQKLDALHYYEGLKRFGFSKKSGIDLPYERRGSIPAISKLRAQIYKATCAYGYGIRANTIQLLKAYNVFNNGGKMITPHLANSYQYEGIEYPIERYNDAESSQVIKPESAARMKKILIKTVLKGTGYKAITPGIEVGGKTGTAHIAKKGKYINSYNTSFVGFANDATHRYTIAVTVVEPTTQNFASLTAVPVFKATLDLLLEEGYLKAAH